MDIDITILKRDNRPVKFNGSKIAVAIKKGFDSIQNPDYNENDVNKVYMEILKQIDALAKHEEYLSIEIIQDMIERELLRQGYQDVYESFSSYRDRRNESRRIFISNNISFSKQLKN